MSLLSTDPNEVWAYFESGTDGKPVPLPLKMANDICENCRHLIPDSPAGCCWWCTWDLTAEQEAEYRALLIRHEARTIREVGR